VGSGLESESVFDNVLVFRFWEYSLFSNQAYYKSILQICRDCALDKEEFRKMLVEAGYSEFMAEKIERIYTKPS
jgi:hypothetical protein